MENARNSDAQSEAIQAATIIAASNVVAALLPPLFDGEEPSEDAAQNDRTIKAFDAALGMGLIAAKSIAEAVTNPSDSPISSAFPTQSKSSKSRDDEVAE